MPCLNFSRPASEPETSKMSDSAIRGETDTFDALPINVEFFRNQRVW